MRNYLVKYSIRGIIRKKIMKGESVLDVTHQLTKELGRKAEGISVRETDEQPQKLRMDDTRLAIVEIVDQIHKEGKSEGVVKCPICGGKIHYLYGGPMAMRAKCDTCGFIAVS